MESSFFSSIRSSFASELSNAAKEHGYSLGKMHCFELVASFHCFNTDAALKASGLLDGPRYPAGSISVDEDAVRSRAAVLKINDPEAVDFFVDTLRSLHEDEFDELKSLANRLERNIKNVCSFDYYTGYQGSALLDEQDWRACGEIASREDFEDFLYCGSPYSTISVLATAYPDPSYGGCYTANPDAVMNIVAYIRDHLNE